MLDPLLFSWHRDLDSALREDNATNMTVFMKRLLCRWQALVDIALS